MNKIIGAFFALCLWSITATAQPLSGSYTVGGATPDYATLQDAANALKRRGVSGPTFFNIRPVTYTRSNSTVLLLDSLVAGLSATNRITFQPDQAGGGNVNNVIFEMNRTNAFTADLNLVVASCASGSYYPDFALYCLKPLNKQILHATMNHQFGFRSSRENRGLVL
jgi:hypothetical protein